MAGAASDGGFARLCRASSRKGMKGKKGREASGTRERIRAVHGGQGSPGCSMHGGGSSTTTVAGMGVGEPSDAQEGTVTAFD